MPGSKTFTSTKNYELLEGELIEEIRNLNTHSYSRRVLNSIIEVAKLCFSSAMCAVFTINSDYIALISNASSSEIITIVCNLLIRLCGIFLLVFILTSVIIKLFSLLFDSLFNSRIFTNRRIRAKRTFQRITVNLLMLAVSFENKCLFYHQKTITNNHSSNASEFGKEEPDESDKQYDEYRQPIMDLEIEYFFQSVLYFERAKEKLNEAIPPKMQNKFKEYINTRYMEYIGFDSIEINLAIGIASLIRLKKYYESLSKADTSSYSIVNRAKEHGYYNSIENSGVAINDQIKQYQDFLVLTRKRRQELSNTSF